MKIDIDIENIDSLENREKLSILSNDILIELLLRNIKLVANYKNITKEIREYIEKNKVDLSWFMTTDKDLKLEGISNVVSTFRLLEILDKENK